MMYSRSRSTSAGRPLPSALPLVSELRRTGVSRPAPDWSKLSRGDAVRVVRRDGTVAAGLIDMLALDRSVFWVIQEEGRGRVMVCSADAPNVTLLGHGEGFGR